jgi:hypothetical protein
MPSAPPITAPDGQSEGRVVLALLALGFALFIATLFYAFVLPSTPDRMDRPSAGLIELSGLWSTLAALPWPVPADPAVLAAAILIVGGGSMVAYALAIIVVWRRPATRRGLSAVLIPATIILTASAIALPTQSGDIIDYLLSGRVSAVHGASPYEVPPDAFPDDALLPYASGTYTSDPEAKPPVWIAAAVGAAALTATASPADMVLVARLLFLALTALNVWLIALILRRWRPEHVLAGLIIYAWSPIVAHHGPFRFDTLMVSFALMAALLLVLDRHAAAMASLTLSILVKLLTLPLLAVSVLGDLVTRRWRRLATTAAIGLGITFLVYLPFEGGVTRVVEHLGFGSGVGGTLPPIVRLGFVGIAGLAVLWAGIRSRGETEGTLQGWAVAGLILIPLTPIGWVWYLLTPIAMVSLSGDRWKTAILVGLSGVTFLADTWIRSSSAAYPLPVPFGLSRAEAVLVGGIAAVIIGALVLIVYRSRRRERVDVSMISPATVPSDRPG